MASEHDSARTPAFYDHESDEPVRGRRAAADWGVNEDIFDRMPSRRFTRPERRAEHRTDAQGAHRVERRVSGPAAGRGAGAAGDDPVRDVKRVELWDAERERATAWGEVERAPKRQVESWIVDDPPSDEGRRVESWLEPEQQPVSRTIVIETGGGVRDEEDGWERSADLDTPGSLRGDGSDADPARPAPRTIVLETGETDALVVRPDGAARREVDDGATPSGRRTVRISGHPDRLPVPRAPRPPRTAIDRIGTSPDRIVAYAVALGFLLVVIAVLTTGH